VGVVAVMHDFNFACKIPTLAKIDSKKPHFQRKRPYLKTPISETQRNTSAP
jgi:hypothetical protein